MKIGISIEKSYLELVSILKFNIKQPRKMRISIGNLPSPNSMPTLSATKLVENKLAARGEPSTKFPRDETRREGSAYSPASIVIPLKRGTLPELPELLKISSAPSTCNTTESLQQSHRKFRKL